MFQDTRTCTVAKSATVSGAVDISCFGSGSFYLPAEFNSENISYQVSDTVDGTFALYYDDGSLETFAAPAAPAWHKIPEGIFAFGAVKFVTDSAPASAAATITVSLKTGPV